MPETTRLFNHSRSETPKAQRGRSTRRVERGAAMPAARDTRRFEMPVFDEVISDELETGLDWLAGEEEPKGETFQPDLVGRTRVAELIHAPQVRIILATEEEAMIQAGSEAGAEAVRMSNLGPTETPRMDLEGAVLADGADVHRVIDLDIGPDWASPRVA